MVSCSKSSTNNTPYKVGGLIFDNKDDYKLYKKIDKNIKHIVKLVEAGIIDLKDVFNKVKRIRVKECYYDAAEEMDGLFKNATKLLCYEGTRFVTDYKVGCCFFDNINIIEYCEIVPCSKLSTKYKVGGLIFDSKDDYKLYKKIDRNIGRIVKLAEAGRIDLKKVFNKVKKINVKECYYDAAEEMDGLFKNTTGLLCYEGTRFVTDYKVACYFFDKINVIEYYDSEDDDY